MSFYSKGLPQNNIRYRTNKSPEQKELKGKNQKILKIIIKKYQL